MRSGPSITRNSSDKSDNQKIQLNHNTTYSLSECKAKNMSKACEDETDDHQAQEVKKRLESHHRSQTSGRGEYWERSL